VIALVLLVGVAAVLAPVVAFLFGASLWGIALTFVIAMAAFAVFMAVVYAIEGL
jgi:hypothetical protein